MSMNWVKRVRLCMSVEYFFISLLCQKIDHVLHVVLAHCFSSVHKPACLCVSDER